jgi:molybdenum cofactor biosynthesis protein B
VQPVSVHLAVLAIAEDPAYADEAITAAVTEPATAAGHRIIERAVVADRQLEIRDQLARWMTNRQIDVVIVTGVSESDHTSQAISPLITQRLPGFTDLFRWLAYQAIGASAMLSNAEAARCGETLVFVLPASVEAVRAAMDKLILPQLDPNTKPKNLIAMLPRLRPNDAVPAPVVPEKTAAGAGPPARLPARRDRPRTGKHVIAHHKASDDAFSAETTRPIDVEKLEQQIALSEGSDPTRQVKAPSAGDDPTDRQTLPAGSGSVRAHSEPIAPPVQSARSGPPPPPRRRTPPPLPPNSSTARRPPVGPPPAPPPPATSAPVDAEALPPTTRRPAPATMRVFPASRARNTHRIIIATLATVFAGFVIAIVWQLASGSRPAESTAAAQPRPPAPPPPPLATVVEPRAPLADAAAPEVDVEAVEVAPPVDAGAVARRPGTHPPAPPRADAPASTDGQHATARTPAPSDHPEPVADGCDEVSCVLSHYEQSCCARYKPAQEQFKPSSGTPDELTRPMVKAAVATVKPRISACNDKLQAKGTVKLAVSVDGEGNVSSVDVADTPDPTLGSCVAAAMRAAKFGKSKTGGSFTYPFVF